MKFSDFPLRPEILQAVVDAGYETPTPIQEQAIPVILTGDDLLGIAQTGTGKTAAFVLPMIERLASGKAKARMPRSLILSPTRELATQSANYFETYGKHLQLTMALLIGGVGMDEQWRRLDRGVDVLIATPGRLLDQFERGKVLLGGVTILVIDEADRMLDMGFMPDVERIVNLVSKRRQTLMFSATMPAEIRRLASAFLTHPKEVQATPPATMAERIEDHVAIVPPRQKFKALRRLIEDQGIDNALIFCNRKREVASLRRQMERVGFNVRDIHGDLDQAQRSAALDAFKRGEIAFLVATDVAARGLDIVMLPCVVNYDVPTHAEDYVHRLGRTGRAGQAGRAFTLVLPDEGRYVDAITRLTGKDIPRLEIAGLDGAELAPATRARGRRGRAAPAAAAASTPAPAAVAPAAVAPAVVANRAAAAAADARPKAETGAEARPDAEVAPEVRPTAEAGTEARSRTEPRRRPQARSRHGAAKEASPPQPQPARAERGRDRPEPAPRPTRHRGRGDGAHADQPVVGMGDHVPLFMRRPVPQIAALPEAAED
jgi:superfamily II DNA/RNA helicase